ncbi:ABC transporter permease [Primorskyibacter sp. S187A]|uniref:ABC transporter permease n=1 Tax=Primorskyibacter sp. S187A TaxID=3415130 RepID=UPI003C7EAB9E
MSDATGPMLAADGTPLKKSLAKSLRNRKIRALLLIAPLLAFVLVTFIAPIGQMLLRSVENHIVEDTLPETVAALASWDANSGAVPDEAVFEALYLDLGLAVEQKLHTRLGSRLNYEETGMSSLFRKTGRRVGRFDTDAYADAFQDIDAAWKDPATWVATFEDSTVRSALPLATRVWDRWAAYVSSEGDDPAEQKLEDYLSAALYYDLRDNDLPANAPANLAALDAAIAEIAPVPLVEQFLDADEDWADLDVWTTMQTYSPRYTTGYFLNAVDMEKSPDGAIAKPENQQIYIKLFWRTLVMSLAITASCILLGYPVAWLLANLSSRTSNLLLILVLLPFWTSLLVRTSAWKVMLQDQGVINDTLVWLGLVATDDRLALINNQTGTIIAMTHILLPFMILPLYSVMKTIPPTYLRAAKSLGATNWTAFWRVYFPQSVPGIGAGSILVFILAIGYYITPEIVGGTSGIFISNRIAYHISSSLNWGLAAALGAILLVLVLGLYWCYDKIVGIDNVKLGG